jgi:micrococcal nuclease
MQVSFRKIIVLLLILLGAPISVSLLTDPTLEPQVPTTENTETTAPLNLPPNHYLVTKVIDGDTIAVDVAGTRTTVRLIGVDTPETVHPTKPVQCFGKEASAAAVKLMQDRVVRLEADSTQGETDKYGRLLAYVFLEDGTHVNEQLLRDGYAYEYTYGDTYEYQETFKAAVEEARTAKRGLWGEGVCVGE